jgi:hypothetical protein
LEIVAHKVISSEHEVLTSEPLHMQRTLTTREVGRLARVTPALLPPSVRRVLS